MKKKFIVFALFFVLSLAVGSSYAMLDMSEGRNTAKTAMKEIKIAYLPDYPPFGEQNARREFVSMFDGFIKEYTKDYNFNIPLTAPIPDNTSQIVQDIRAGRYDLFVGIYNEKQLSNSLDIIYPAATFNPIHIAMFKDRKVEMKNYEDLKNYKGAIHKKDRFSEHVKKQLEQYNLETVDTSYDLFKKLALGEIDYIVTSQYFCRIEAAKLGMTGHIIYSERPLWTIPVFFGISKFYKQRTITAESLGKEFKKEEIKEKINNYLIDMINTIESDNAGVVPPTFLNN